MLGDFPPNSFPFEVAEKLPVEHDVGDRVSWYC